MTSIHDEKQAQAATTTSIPMTQVGSIYNLPDEVEVARIRRKIDCRLLPALSVLYLMSYLDRGNSQFFPSLLQHDTDPAFNCSVGNAAIIGLKEDLHLTANQYNLCLTIFFIPYALFEIPSNMILKFLRPAIWVPIMMVAWGTIAT